MTDETTFTYKVADHIFSINAKYDLEIWKKIKWHYDPFATTGNSDSCFRISLHRGRLEVEGMKDVFIDRNVQPGMMQLNVYSDDDDLVFEIRQPEMPRANGWVRIGNDMNDSDVYVDEADTTIHRGWHAATLTSCIMLSFMLATTRYNTLMAHAAAVIYKGKAYMFIGKSGTGKSTHTRLWLDNIPETFHLNDDHPIVRIGSDGQVTVYGSPWSGKTDCYHSEQAPAAGIVRIVQAPHNKIRHLSPIEAYASLVSSFSGMTWIGPLADARHQSIETLVKEVPCYTLECLPDCDAAITCCNFITKR